MKRTARFIIYRPWLIISATMAITLAFVAALLFGGVRFNGSPETLARNDDALRFAEQTRKIFGDDRVIIVALEAPDIFTSRVLGDLAGLTGKLSSIAGVEEARSLTNIEAIRGDKGDISIERLVPASLLRGCRK
jgi:predicted RND superfamily exporter protein